MLMQDDFTGEDFEAMPAPLTYNMFKSKSAFPLHTAIRTRREDVVFLYLVEHDAEVSLQTLVLDSILLPENKIQVILK